MNKLTILVDMDDTIEHLLQAWVDYLNEHHETTTTVEDVHEWDLSSSFPTLTREQIYAPLLDDALWERVQPMQYAADVLKQLKEDGHNIFIVTSTAYQTVKAKIEKVLFRYFPFIKWNDVIIAHNKQMIKGDILIDDAPHNLEGGDYMKILMTASHNKSYDAKANGMHRVNDWMEIYELVDHYLQFVHRLSI